MAGTSATPNLLSLPTEILEQILTHVLQHDPQIAGYCSCAGTKRDRFNRKAKVDYYGTRVDLKLVNKTLCNVVREIVPMKITAVVCSLACLKRLLAHVKTQDNLRDSLRTIIVEEKRRFPVDVCDDNSWHLFKAAEQWVKELADECGKAIKAEGFTWSRSDFNMAAWCVDKSKSAAQLKVQKDVVWRVKK